MAFHANRRYGKKEEVALAREKGLKKARDTKNFDRPNKGGIDHQRMSLKRTPAIL